MFPKYLSHIRLSTRYYLLGLLLLQSNHMYPQEDRNTSFFYNWFDRNIGDDNSGLYNGTIYKNDFTVINEKHQFFISEKFSLGTVTYDGQTYYDQKLRYDLFKDALLITPKSNASALVVTLENTRTEGFSMEGHTFIRGDENIEGLSKTLGFCEIISKNDTSKLVKKYRKKKIDKRETKLSYQEFEQNINHYVLSNGKFYPVNSRREWILVFPNYKKTIKDYYKEYGALKKTDIDSFMKLIFERLFSLEQAQNTAS